MTRPTSPFPDLPALPVPVAGGDVALAVPRGKNLPSSFDDPLVRSLLAAETARLGLSSAVRALVLDAPPRLAFFLFAQVFEEALAPRRDELLRYEQRITEVEAGGDPARDLPGRGLSPTGEPLPPTRTGWWTFLEHGAGFSSAGEAVLQPVGSAERWSIAYRTLMGYEGLPSLVPLITLATDASRLFGWCLDWGWDVARTPAHPMLWPMQATLLRYPVPTLRRWERVPDELRAAARASLAAEDRGEPAGITLTLNAPFTTNATALSFLKAVLTIGERIGIERDLPDLLQYFRQIAARDDDD